MPFLLALCLTLLAPIPKGGGAYSGHIAVLLAQPTPQILLLKPNGEEVTRVILKTVKGQLTDIRQARDGKFAIIGTSEANVGTRYYLVPILDKGNEKLLYETTGYSTTWCISKDGQTAFFSEVQPQPAAPNVAPPPYKHFALDIKTGKMSEIDLGGKYSIVDLGQENDDLLLSHHTKDDGTSHYCLVSRKTKKITEKFDEGMQQPLLMSNAKSCMLFTNIRNGGGILPPIPVGGGFAGMSFTIKMFDITTKKTTDITLPTEGDMTNVRSVSADPEHVAYGWQVKDECRICVTNVPKKTAKTIYTLKAGELLADFDWR